MIKQINRFFSVILLASCLTGMFVPSFGESTSIIVIASLACVIFSSFFQINLSFQSLMADLRISVLFILIRFILLPAALFVAINTFSSLSALVILLTMLLPAGVSSPAFSALFGGKPDLSLKILLFTSFLSIITIPYLLKLLLGTNSELPASSLLLTLLWTIVLPFILHLLLRRIKTVRNLMLHYNSVFTIICLSVLGIVVVAKNKSTIIENPGLIGIYTIAAFLLFAFMYIVGYLFVPKGDQRIRRTLSISSGANNMGLGVTITALYFTGEVNIFFIIAQIVWVLVLIPIRQWLLKK